MLQWHVTERGNLRCAHCYQEGYAGGSLLAVQPDGDLLPCRRMPIRVGNLLEKPLAELYEQSKLLSALRDRSHISEGCHRCAYARICRGGLRCLAYAITGDPLSADPGCWLAVERRLVDAARGSE